MQRLVVIGGTAAGMSAATQARRGDAKLPITVFERSGFVTYGSCGLPYFISDEIKSTDNMVVYTPTQLREDRDIDVRTHHEVLSIDPRSKTVVVKNLESREVFEQSFTKLVIATGASPIVPSIDGIKHENIVTLRNIEDGVKIKQLVQSGEVKKVAILGAGFIGLEMAESFIKCDLDVSVFEMLPQILPQIGSELSSLVEEELTRNGVKLFKGTEVKGFKASEDGKVKSVVVSTGENFDADMVLVSVGARPNSQLADAAGIQVGFKGAVVVDRHMRTSLPDIWACGDCAVSFHRITHQPDYIPLGTTANKQGKIAGANVLGGKVVFPGVLGTQVTKIFDTFVASTGLTMEQAQDSGFNPLKVTIRHTDKAGNYPGSKPLYISLIIDKGKGKILGAQLVGGEGVAKRVDVIVAAITAEMSVYDLNELDLSYAPPVAPVYDPILIAASVGIKTLEREGRA